MTKIETPSRAKRLSAWNVLMRQCESMVHMADTIQYEDKNPDAARIIRKKANDLREIADWLREVE